MMRIAAATSTAVDGGIRDRRDDLVLTTPF
jgi:hypothetical protein